MSARPFQFVRGAIHFPELALWLDAHSARGHGERVFVSHAHSDHTGSHREVILSEGTGRLMQARVGGKRVEHILPFLEPRRFEGPGEPFQITLLPAGHILGSAMSLIECSGQSLLYTGDFKLKPGLSAEACNPSRAFRCDILVMETTFGRPQYRFPPASEVLREIVRFCEEALRDDEVPVLLCYSLGKSQELLAGLADSGLPVMLHSAAHEMTKIYEQLGQFFPPYEVFDPVSSRGKVLICPPNALKTFADKLPGLTRTAVVSGWAMDTSCRYRHRVDAAFALSDHADFPDLIEFARRVQPKRVYTLHGHAADFAQTLRELGFDAQALSENDQLQLPLWDTPAHAANGHQR